ncbi:hypothetical protein OsJ_28441 [Oryza sativa Japonica Group]|uniref:Uncharacterized protein n=1 Tax=Oryza sativa subsp. japonica TaxID=39947 RepID=B9G274_ORYSJ|nr:hypothetical protein OsJ_28441 [Oryza sativa Japonica Group]
MAVKAAGSVRSGPHLRLLAWTSLRAPYYASKIATNLDYNFRLQGSLSARLSSCQARSTNLVAQLKNSMLRIRDGGRARQDGVDDEAGEEEEEPKLEHDKHEGHCMAGSAATSNLGSEI